MLKILEDFYFPFLRRYRYQMALYILVLMILYFLQPILLPRLFNQILDHISTRGVVLRKDIEKISWLLISIAFLGYVKNWIEAFLTTRQFQWTREELYNQLLKFLELKVHSIRVGEFITLVNYLPREIRYLTENMMNMMPVVFGTLFLFLYTLYVDRHAGFLFGISLLVSVYVICYSPWSRQLAQQSRRRTEQIMKNNAKMTEEIYQLDQIYTNNQINQKMIENNFREDSLKDAFEQSVQTSNKITFVLFVWNVMLTACVLSVMYMKDHTKRKSRFRSYAFVLAFFMMMLWNNLFRFMTFIMASQNVAVYYQSFMEMIHHGEKDANGTRKLSDPFDIAFENVSYRYNDDAPWVVRDLTWRIPEKSKWVLMGPSGKGKSTILRLILRFFPPTVGSITIGNAPIVVYDVQSIRERICYIAQDTLLFEKSIYENILFGNDDTGETIDTIQDMLTRYNLMYIFQAPGETPNDALRKTCGVDGRNLSKGQQKIIIIARCLLKKNKISVYLMDEPLASLDRQTQESVLHWIADTIPDKTVILTTHITDHSLFQQFRLFSLSS